MSKIIQIVGDQDDNLCALDDEGSIWYLYFDRQSQKTVWKLISNTEPEDDKEAKRDE